MGGLVAVDSVSTAVVDTDRAEVVDIDGTELRWPGQSLGRFVRGIRDPKAAGLCLPVRGETRADGYVPRETRCCTAYGPLSSDAVDETTWAHWGELP